MDKHLADVGKIIPTVTCWIVAEGKVLLMKRSEDSKYFPGYMIGPGGNIDETEDCATAAIREVHEETGITITKSQMKLRAIGIGRHLDKNLTFITFIFIVKLNNVSPTIESKEGTLEWVNINDLDNKNLLPGFRYYQKHVLSDNPLVMYTNLELENLEVKNEVNVNFV